MTDIAHGLDKAADGTFTLAVKNLTRDEALECLILIRRHRMYRAAGIDARTVDDVMASMSKFEVDTR